MVNITPYKVLRIATCWLFVAVVLFSSVVVNFFQIICLSCIWLPIRQRWAINQALSNRWWEVWCFVQESYFHIPFRFTGDAIGASENAILIGNHRAGMDFPVGVSVAARAIGIGCGRMMTMMKAVLQYVPMIGWTHRLQGSLFLKRNMEQDQVAISAKLQDMEGDNFPRPFWIGVYPEGTRITEKNKADGHRFAQQRGLPLLQNVLLPRTKGFVTLAKSLPTAINVVYDVTISYSTREMFLNDILFNGGYKTTAVHVHVKKYNWSELPKTEAELNQWLIDRFVEKDKMLDYFNEHGYFPGEIQAAHTVRLDNRFITLFAVWSIIFSLFIALTMGTGIGWIVTNALSLYALYVATSRPTIMPTPEQFTQRHQADVARRAKKHQ